MESGSIKAIKQIEKQPTSGLYALINQSLSLKAHADVNALMPAKQCNSNHVKPSGFKANAPHKTNYTN